MKWYKSRHQNRHTYEYLSPLAVLPTSNIHINWKGLQPEHTPSGHVRYIFILKYNSSYNSFYTYFNISRPLSEKFRFQIVSVNTTRKTHLRRKYMFLSINSVTRPNATLCKKRAVHPCCNSITYRRLRSLYVQVNDHNARKMKQAAYIHLQQRLIMHGDIPPVTHTTLFWGAWSQVRVPWYSASLSMWSSRTGSLET